MDRARMQEDDHMVEQNSSVDAFYDDEDYEDLPPYDATNRYIHSEESDVEDKDVAAYSLEEYIGELKSKAAAPRPQSAPAGKRGQMQGEIVSETFTPNTGGSKSSSRIKQAFSNDNDVHIAESVLIPSSPYDEEVAFEYQAGDDEDIDSAYLDSRRGRPMHNSNSAKSEDKNWIEENRRYLMASEEANIPSAPKPLPGATRPRPSSADPRLRQSNMSLRRTSERPSSAGRLSGTARGFSADGRRNSTPTRPRDSLRTSAEKLGAVKDLVEDLVRSTVKKADLYHMIQVSLGFIDDYVLIPPRGAIITGKKKQWLTARDLQAAFISARLCLTEAQHLILRSLVYSFAQQYDTLYASSAAKEEPKAEDGASTEGALKKGVFGPSQSLSSLWLKRYLIHLRLSKKVSSAELATTSLAAASTTAIPGPAPSTVTGSVGASPAGESPLAWTDWLGKKLQSEVKRDSVKPREFEKALNGQPHPLSKEDVELMLKTYSVLPADVLQQEVECRIESWLLDMDGRRDFQHALNVKIRHWIWKKKINEEKVKLPKNEKGYWQIWQKLPEEEKKTVKAGILSTIIQEKRADLMTQERTKQTLTKELYWKFDTDRQRKECKWKSWLVDHIAKFKRDLDEFRATEQDRLKRVAALQSKRKTVAGLSEVQTKLKKVQEDYQMDAYHQIELQKAINALRRSAMIRGVAKGTVITKEDFDKHIKGILAPYISLDESGNATCTDVPRSATPARGPIRQSDLQNMFHQELKVAVDKVVELEKERTVKSTQVYQSWLADKQRAEEEKRQKKADEEEAKKKEKELREKRGKKAYQKWCRLSQKDMYKSRVDSKPHQRPEARTLTHKDRWNADKELHDHYAEIEKKM